MTKYFSAEENCSTNPIICVSLFLWFLVAQYLLSSFEVFKVVLFDLTRNAQLVLHINPYKRASSVSGYLTYANIDKYRCLFHLKCSVFHCVCMFT